MLAKSLAGKLVRDRHMSQLDFCVTEETHLRTELAAIEANRRRLEESQQVAERTFLWVRYGADMQDALVSECGR